MSRGQFQTFSDVYILDGVRTPMVDYMGAFADANPIDLGIKVAREVLARTGIDATQVDSVLAGNMAPGGFDQFYVPRHIGLYAGVPQVVPALMVQRICGTGFELFRQAGEQIGAGVATTGAGLVAGPERGAFAAGTAAGAVRGLSGAGAGATALGFAGAAAGADAVTAAAAGASRKACSADSDDIAARRACSRSTSRCPGSIFRSPSMALRAAV